MQQGFEKIGLRISAGRMQTLFSFLDGNSNESVDYSEFMQQLSRSCSAECNTRAQVWGKDRDSMHEVLVRDAIRSRFQDAQQVVICTISRRRSFSSFHSDFKRKNIAIARGNRANLLHHILSYKLNCF
jgi:hypothetical protein